MRFANSCALVTGGASGIGREICLRLGREGAAVQVTDLNLDGAETVAETIRSGGGNAAAVQAEISDEQQVEAMAKQARDNGGPIDLLVNCASNQPSDGLIEMSVDDWDRDVRVVLRGAYLCTRAVLAEMSTRGSGAIVNVASVNGLGFYGNEAYSAAKAGMISLTRSVAVRYGPRGVRCNAVAPGTVRTPIWDARVAADPTVLDRAGRWYPLQRVGEVADVAEAVLFLASRDAGWITGVVLPVDGGLGAGNFPMAASLVVDSDW